MKQAVYQLSHYNFIKDDSLDEKVVNEFVEIALNLFAFKANSNYTYEKFLEMQEYKSKNSGAWKESDDFEENVEHEKNLKYYDDIPYDNTNMSAEELIYKFIDTHDLNKNSFKDLLDTKSMYLDKENIREQFFLLEDDLLRNFNSSIKTIIRSIYELLNNNKDLVPHIIDISTLHKYFEYIQEHSKKLITDTFVKNYIFSYFDIKPKNRRYNFQIDAYENFINLNYPNLLSEINKKKNQELKNNLTMEQISELLSKTHRGWNPEDAYVLNNIDTQTYIQYIKESADFYYEVISFLPCHINTDDFYIAIKNIKLALLSLKDENTDNMWRISKMLKEKNIKLEDKK
jgi:hypothetical protein